ncbi:VUT family protein [Lentzea sp. NPDC058436]|uniref:VUT family protein n=1 Tax=Lentzea sp. NPDC058436 TaxID=3346499 RepID=UPI00364BC12B
MTRLILLLTVAAYVGTVLLANIVTSQFGLIAAGFGLLVPAGTYTAALALSLRDAVQEFAGRSWVWVGIATGTILSVLVADGRIALASGAAFALSEFLDMVVYTRLRERSWRLALVSSNAVGSVADTVLFLWLSGFGLTVTAVAGQVLVKAVWVTGVCLLLGELMRRIAVTYRKNTLPAT